MAGVLFACALLIRQALVGTFHTGAVIIITHFSILENLQARIGARHVPQMPGTSLSALILPHKDTPANRKNGLLLGKNGILCYNGPSRHKLTSDSPSGGRQNGRSLGLFSTSLKPRVPGRQRTSGKIGGEARA